MSQGEYALAPVEAGASVAIIASEPVTRNDDWVAVPRNTALVVAREKAGRINVLRSPLANGNRPCGHLENGDVVRCLEAVCSASEVSARAWAPARRRRNHNSGVLTSLLISPNYAGSSTATRGGAISLSFAAHSVHLPPSPTPCSKEYNILTKHINDPQAAQGKMQSACIEMKASCHVSLD